MVIIKKKKDNKTEGKINTTKLQKTSQIITPSEEAIIETRNIMKNGNL